MASLTLTPELLALRTRGVTREVARDRLRKILEEAARLETQPVHPADPASDDTAAAGDDSEAVHDFRVALRRLRTWLDAFRPALDDTVTRRSRRRLRRLWRLAGKARDLEVQQATVAALTVAANPSVASRTSDTASHLADNAQRARRKLTRTVVDVLPRAAAKLARQLEADDISGDAGAAHAAADPLMAASMARLLRARLKELDRSLDRLRRGTAIKRLHAVRIAAKQLRYLLDAFDERSRLAAMAVRRLARLQDVYGELRDAQVLERRLAAQGVPSSRRDPLQMVLRRQIRRDLRRARQVARSRDIATARAVTERLIRQLERRRARS